MHQELSSFSVGGYLSTSLYSVTSIHDTPPPLPFPSLPSLYCPDDTNVAGRVDGATAASKEESASLLLLLLLLWHLRLNKSPVVDYHVTQTNVTVFQTPAACMYVRLTTSTASDSLLGGPNAAKQSSATQKRGCSAEHACTDRSNPILTDATKLQPKQNKVTDM